MPEEIMPWEPRTVKSFEDFVAQWVCMPKAVAWVLLVLCAAGTVCGQGAAAATPVQTQTDEYTRYELLSTESSSFAIPYEVTATTAGAFNPIRKGSVASGIRSMHRFEVYDLIFRSGKRIQDAGGNHALGTAHSEKLRRLRCAMAMHAQGGGVGAPCVVCGRDGVRAGGGCGRARANADGRVHALRTAVGGELKFGDPLRGDGYHRRGIQSDPQGQRGQRHSQYASI